MPNSPPAVKRVLAFQYSAALAEWVAAALAGAFGAFWVNRQIWGRQKKN